MAQALAGKQSTGYVPGVCNLNTEETKKRRMAGYFGVGLYVIVIVALLVAKTNRFTRLVLFIPAFIAAIGFLQAKNKFCVSFAASGLENTVEGSKAPTSITDAAAKAKDKIKANSIYLQSLAVGVVFALLPLLLPK